ncbi:MAG: DDE-type integrase/transposase/recombinase [Pseudomonadales bacterium]|nr:DDE-type integrase/transposase/recombinase [Pseudomonadales bacterium]
MKVKGEWKYYYHAVDKQGNIIDFLLTDKRDTKAALRFLNKASARNGKSTWIKVARTKQASAVQSYE